MLGYQVLRWDAPDQEMGLPGGLWSQEPSADIAFEGEIAAGAQRAVLLEVSWEGGNRPLVVSRIVSTGFSFAEDEMDLDGVTVRVISRYESVGPEEEGKG